MANFEHFFTHVFKVEGGYQKNKADKGNYNSKGHLVGTKFGISAGTLEFHLGKIVTVRDMINLTKQVATNIYKSLYWDICKGDKILNQNIANILIDHSVNANPIKASRLLYSIVNKFGYNFQVKSVISDELINTLNNLDQQQVFDAIKSARISYYKSIGGKFLKGWLNRMAKFIYQ